MIVAKIRIITASKQRLEACIIYKHLVLLYGLENSVITNLLKISTFISVIFSTILLDNALTIPRRRIVYKSGETVEKEP